MSREAFLGTSNEVKSLGGQGCAPYPAGGAYSCSSRDLLAGREAPSPRTPSLLLVVRASNLVAFGHSFQTP